MPTPTWLESEIVSDLPLVHEAFQAFADDQTGDNATGLVQAILEAAAPDTARLDKLLSMVDHCKAKFGPGNVPHQLALTIRNSVETSAGYRDQLRKLIDELKPTYTKET